MADARQRPTLGDLNATREYLEEHARLPPDLEEFAREFARRGKLSKEGKDLIAENPFTAATACFAAAHRMRHSFCEGIVQDRAPMQEADARAMLKELRRAILSHMGRTKPPAFGSVRQSLLPPLLESESAIDSGRIEDYDRLAPLIRFVYSLRVADSCAAPWNRPEAARAIRHDPDPRSCPLIVAASARQERKKRPTALDDAVWTLLRARYHAMERFWQDIAEKPRRARAPRGAAGSGAPQ